MSKIIATHSYSDMDALLGVYLVGKYLCNGDYSVEFYPANTEIKGIKSKVDYIVDFGKEYDPDNGIFDHHKNFEFESAVNLINEYLKKKKIETGLELLIKYVHWQDLTGNAIRHFGGKKLPELEFASIHNILSAFRDNGLSDHEIYTKFEMIFSSLESRTMIYKEARKNFQKVVTFYNDQIAIVKNGCGLETSLIWEDYTDIEIVIYSEEKNSGIIRRDGLQHDLKKLESVIDEDAWFYHISGFIAARGTKKAPSKKRSKYSAEDLAELVKKVFYQNI